LKNTTLLLGVSLLPFIIACSSGEDKGSKGSNNYNPNGATITLPSSYTPDTGQLLGAQCAQCHGTNGVSVNKWDSIVGEDNLHKEMFEYENTHIMTAQARGYTPEEINNIEIWVQTLSQ